MNIRLTLKFKWSSEIHSLSTVIIKTETLLDKNRDHALLSFLLIFIYFIFFCIHYNRTCLVFVCIYAYTEWKQCEEKLRRTCFKRHGYQQYHNCLLNKFIHTHTIERIFNAGLYFIRFLQYHHFNTRTIFFVNRV